MFLFLSYCSRGALFVIMFYFRTFKIYLIIPKLRNTNVEARLCSVLEEPVYIYFVTCFYILICHENDFHYRLRYMNNCVKVSTAINMQL